KFVRNLPYRGTMVVERAVQRVTFESFPVAGHRGVFEGAEVRIESVDGRVVSRRLEPRTAFQDFRHRLCGTAWIFSILLAKPVGTISVFPSASMTPRMN